MWSTLFWAARKPDFMLCLLEARAAALQAVGESFTSSCSAVVAAAQRVYGLMCRLREQLSEGSHGSCELGQAAALDRLGNDYNRSASSSCL